MRREKSMASFWDRRADEDAYFFVDDRQAFGQPDLDRFWRGGEEALDGMLAALEVRLEPTDEILEIGCGLGRITRVLAARGASVRALDVSERMLRQARELNPGLENVEWVLGDGCSLAGVESQSVDVCFSHVVFQHIPDPDVTLAYVTDMGRTLRPGGWAGFHVSNDPDVHRRPSIRTRLGRRMLAAVGRSPRGQTEPAWLGSAVDLEKLSGTAAAAGLEMERVVGAGTQWCFVLLRKRRA